MAAIGCTGRELIERATRSSQREVAIVRLPHEVMRGWEWAPAVMVVVAMGVGAVLHLTGSMTLKMGRRSNTPMPDWLVVVIATGLFAMLVVLVAERVMQARKARRWRREVAMHSSRVSAREAATNMIEQMGLDAEAFATIRHEDFVRTERAIGHRLPWLWVDELAMATLAQPTSAARFQFEARRAKSMTAVVAAWVGGTAASLVVIAWVGNKLTGGVRNPPSDWLVGGVVVVAVVVGAVLMALPRLKVAFVPGRAVLTAGRREVAVLSAERTFVVVAPRYQHVYRRRKEQVGIRWWFYVPGRRGVYVDDLTLDATPWEEAINRVGFRPPSQVEAAASCGQCGYPTEGLRGDRCPECGGRIARVVG